MPRLLIAMVFVVAGFLVFLTQEETVTKFAGFATTLAGAFEVIRKQFESQPGSQEKK